MKKKEFKELMTKDKKELITMVKAKKLELFAFTSKIYAGREKNLKKGKNLKREIAQLMTILNMKGKK